MKARRDAQEKAASLRAYVAFVGLAVLAGKVVLASRLEQGIWIDGDGLRRATEITAMATYGVAAPGIDALTAGYATIVHVAGVVVGATELWPIALLQSAFFSFAVWYMTVALLRTRVSWATVPLAYLILLNPALSLSTLALSGDSVTASLLMLAVGQLIRDIATDRADRRPRSILITAVLLSLAALIEPTLAVGSIAFLLSWAAARGNREQAIWISSGALALLLALPLLLLVRNQIANNSAALPASSSQGTSSGFVTGQTDRCGIGSLDVVSLNGSTFDCLMTWYREKSASTSEAAMPNAVAFWSPWVGPLADPSVRDNPWVALQPMNLLDGSHDSPSIVDSPIASIVSWLWVLACVIPMAVGFLTLRGLGDLETEISVAAGWLIAGSWLVGVLTHADSSSRLPVMGMALLLQLLGWRFMLTRGREPSRDPFAPA